MHALLVTADVEPDHEEESLEYLRTMLPQLEQIPGLVSGLRAGDDKRMARA